MSTEEAKPPVEPNMFDSSSFITHLHDMSNLGLSPIDVIVDYSEKHNIEIEVLASVVNQSPKLKSMMTTTAEDLNLIKRSARLPGC